MMYTPGREGSAASCFLIFSEMVEEAGTVDPV